MTSCQPVESPTRFHSWGLVVRSSSRRPVWGPPTPQPGRRLPTLFILITFLSSSSIAAVSERYNQSGRALSARSALLCPRPPLFPIGVVLYNVWSPLPPALSQGLLYLGYTHLVNPPSGPPSPPEATVSSMSWSQLRAHYLFHCTNRLPFSAALSPQTVPLRASSAA